MKLKHRALRVTHDAGWIKMKMRFQFLVILLIATGCGRSHQQIPYAKINTVEIEKSTPYRLTHIDGEKVNTHKKHPYILVTPRKHRLTLIYNSHTPRPSNYLEELILTEKFEADEKYSVYLVGDSFPTKKSQQEAPLFVVMPYIYGAENETANQQLEPTCPTPVESGND